MSRSVFLELNYFVPSNKRIVGSKGVLSMGLLVEEGAPFQSTKSGIGARKKSGAGREYPNIIADNSRLELPWEYQKLAETDDHNVQGGDPKICTRPISNDGFVKRTQT